MNDTNLRHIYYRITPYIFQFILTIAIISIFFTTAIDKIDHSSLITKHYVVPTFYFYGGYTDALIKIDDEYIFYNKEGLPNYYNIKPLMETEEASKRKHKVQGFPATERVLASILYYISMHIIKLTIQNNTILISTLAWFLAIFCAHKLAHLWFADRFSPWISAIIVALTPVFVINFSNIKFQPLGGVYFIFGVYIFEKFILKGGKGYVYSFIMLAPLFFLGLFSMGGGWLVWAYIMARYLLLDITKYWRMLALVTSSLIVAKICMNHMTEAYNLPAVTDRYNINLLAMLSESYTWLCTYFSGGNVGGLKFIGYPGLNFFKYLLPMLGYGMFRNNVPVLILALGAVFCDKRTWPLTLLAILIFLLGHGGTIVTGWSCYYDYASLPATLLFSILAARCLSFVIEQYPKLIPITALMLLLAIPLRINSYAFYRDGYLLLNGDGGIRAPLQLTPEKYLFIHWDNGNEYAY